jgi:hypothetical protein
MKPLKILVSAIEALLFQTEYKIRIMQANNTILSKIYLFLGLGTIGC